MGGFVIFMVQLGGGAAAFSSTGVMYARLPERTKHARVPERTTQAKLPSRSR